MTAILTIMMEITGEVIANDYPYSLAMSGISGSNLEIMIPIEYAISKQDLQKAGEFRGVTIPTRDLIRILTNKGTVIRATDFARARGQTQYANLDIATQSGVIQNNIELVFSLIFKKGNVLKIQSQDYSVYSSDLKKWSKSTTSGNPSYKVDVSLFLVKGTKLSFRKRQELSCSNKRRKLRSSLKSVLNIDIGEPKGKQFVPKRLVPPQVSRPRTSFTYPRYQYPYPAYGRQYPLGYPYAMRPQYRQYGGRKRAHTIRRKKCLRKTRKLKQISKN